MYRRSPMSGLVMPKVRPLMSDYSRGRRLNSVKIYISSMSKLTDFTRVSSIDGQTYIYMCSVPSMVPHKCGSAPSARTR
jgi:hypothetical protein